ncbi:Heat shock 70 kDa protein cognate 5 [Bienertia sinuspersici]
MGGFIEFDEADPLGLKNFMRLKVLIDVKKPLRRGVKIVTKQNSTKWVDIKYERLGVFCYFYGRLGHVDRDCAQFTEEEGLNKEVIYKYGPWLRAPPLKRSKMPKEECEKERKLMTKLQCMAGDKPGRSHEELRKDEYTSNDDSTDEEHPLNGEAKNDDLTERDTVGQDIVGFEEYGYSPQNNFQRTEARRWGPLVENNLKNGKGW